MFHDDHDRLSCSQIAARLQLHVDGEADEDSASVGEHVRECSRCARVAALYGAVKGVLAHSADSDEGAVDRLAEFTRHLAAAGEEPPPQPGR